MVIKIDFEKRELYIEHGIASSQDREQIIKMLEMIIPKMEKKSNSLYEDG